MNYFQGALLGIVQGLTEFLPVSSSGHLVIVQGLLGIMEPGITFEVLVHFGTVLSVIWVFSGDILRILKQFSRERTERHFLLMLILGIIPTGIMGLLLKDLFAVLYESVFSVGLALLFTGMLLFILQKFPPGNKKEGDIRPADALLVSIAQGLAIIPGLSRSGSTIVTALWRGLDRETAVRYSFLLSVPVILGATVVELKDLAGTAGGLTGPTLLGALAAFVSGIFAIKVFVRFLKSGRFHYFAYYCWLAGALVIVLKLLGY